MLGINYESSDEEETVAATNPQVRLANTSEESAIATNIELSNAPSTVTPAHAPVSRSNPAAKSAPALVAELPMSSGPVNGPAQGPTVSPPPADVDSHVPPGSPYTSKRSTIQNLTLPTVPNFDIPPSPPGLPPQRSTKKFAQFLELKKKGQHFNQRLENSSVLRDPSHLRKLMDFAGISEEDQYVSALSDDISVPTVFPKWVYFEELNASQKRISKAKEEERRRIPRESLEFVSASKSGASSGTGTPSARVPRQSAAERIMAGLDKEPSSRSSSHSSSKRMELEHRERDDSSSRSRWRSRSRSPKRRRSRSGDGRR